MEFRFKNGWDYLFRKNFIQLSNGWCSLRTNIEPLQSKQACFSILRTRGEAQPVKVLVPYFSLAVCLSTPSIWTKATLKACKGGSKGQYTRRVLLQGHTSGVKLLRVYQWFNGGEFILRSRISPLQIACGTGRIFCVLIEAKGGSAKNPTCPHTIVQPLPPPDTPSMTHQSQC